jgi:hypothetical protein
MALLTWKSGDVFDATHGAPAGRGIAQLVTSAYGPAAVNPRLHDPAGDDHGGTERKETHMSKDLSKGDRVSWDTPQGRTQGEVVEKKTKDFQHDGQKFTASEDEPAYIVKSEKTDATAAHKGSALNKLKG